MIRSRVLVLTAGVLLGACAELSQLRALVQAPRFEEAQDHEPAIRLVGPGAGHPLGGASVRLWARVTNPNPFGLTLGRLEGALYLEDQRAADASFPLGLPLAAMGETTIPIDLSISFPICPGWRIRSVARLTGSRWPITSRAPSASMPGGSASRCSDL